MHIKQKAALGAANTKGGKADPWRPEAPRFLFHCIKPGDSRQEEGAEGHGQGQGNELVQNVFAS